MTLCHFFSSFDCSLGIEEVEVEWQDESLRIATQNKLQQAFFSPQNDTWLRLSYFKRLICLHTVTKYADGRINNWRHE